MPTSNLASEPRDELGTKPRVEKRASVIVAVIFDALNPIPFGFFVGALIFDVVYARSADVLWSKSAAWLISIGLFFAVVPRLINLVRVWFPGGQPSTACEKVAFLLYLLGVAATIINAFVHSRDAYGIVPAGVWLSILTVALLLFSNVLVTLQHLNNDNKGLA